MRGSSLSMRCRQRVVVALALLTFFVAAQLSSIRVNAQVESGINGTVADATGASLPGATVSVENPATGFTTSTTANSSGDFTLPGLNPGHYTVAATAAGFKKQVQTDVLVEIGKMTPVNLQMTPGETTETVNVEAQALSINTTTPELGTTLEPALVSQLPIEINGGARQIDAFVFLAPGVQGNAFNKTINGGVNFESEVEFNGIPAVQAETPGFQTLLNPPFEMINEFRVVSSAFSAQYGLAKGAVTYQTASGTNRLHGDAYDIIRNQLFDSDGFFPTAFGPNGSPRPPVNQQNNYGFTVSGPVWIPKLYKGLNRTFFLFTDDWYRENLAQKQVGTVPTTAMKQGDFSGFVDATGKVIPIYDPLTGQPFPGNIIPQTRFSPLSASILKDIPDPNRSGLNGGNLSNIGPQIPSLSIKQNLWGYTIDHKLTDSQTVRFSQWRAPLNSATLSSANVAPATSPISSLNIEPSLGSGWLLNYVKTFNPNLVMTWGVSVIGAINSQHNGLQNVNFPAVANSVIFPNVLFDGQNAPSTWGQGLINLVNRKLGIAVVNNYLWTKGRNTFNIGLEYRKVIMDDNECLVACGGTFNFSQRTTSVPDVNNPNFGSYGSSFASFLLGQADGASRQSNNALAMRSSSWSPYIEDDFKVNDRLTVNLGLRWDILIPLTEAIDNRITYFDPNIPNPGADGLLGAASKLGTCTGCAGVRRAAIDWPAVGPRVGFSYKINDKTLLRSGFFLSILDGGAYAPGDNRVGQDYDIILNGTFFRNSNGTSVPAYGSWDGTALPPTVPVPFSPSVGNGSVLYGFDPKTSGLWPYNEAWNVSVERSLNWNVFLTASYVGNRDVHLPSQLNPYDQLDPSYLSYGGLLGSLVTSPAAVAAGIKIPYAKFLSDFGSAATVSQALLPYPQYAGLQNNFDYKGSALYNALQLQVEKRFSGGLSFLVAFTLAKNLANVNSGFAAFAAKPLNKFDQKLEWAPSVLDQKYENKYVATYELPIGPGKKFLNQNNVVNRLAGGWQISTILDYEGGSPFGPTETFNPVNNGDSYGGYDRPNIVQGVKLQTFSYSRTKSYLTGHSSTAPVQFPTNAFALTNPFALGDTYLTYGTLRTPPLRIESFSAVKHFPIAEGVSASLRVDYFNAFNRTQLQPPDESTNDTTFGQVTNLSSQISNRQGQATFRIEF
ncbi:MAG TPA: carboxypeptidase-like regulatory domain-containing protein [Acidobacteriaceae bacterium]|nr:carboxypeptidase-like regulatory domain-containing protein [Acidobacteriaceae bacterium]